MLFRSFGTFTQNRSEFFTREHEGKTSEYKLLSKGDDGYILQSESSQEVVLKIFIRTRSYDIEFWMPIVNEKAEREFAALQGIQKNGLHPNFFVMKSLEIDECKYKHNSPNSDVKNGKALLFDYVPDLFSVDPGPLNPLRWLEIGRAHV